MFSDASVKEIDIFRRKCQRVDKRALLFLDETHVLSNAVPLYSLAPAGEKVHLTVDRESFAIRVDVLDSCAVDALGPYRIVSAFERRQMHVKGIRKDMFLEFFEDEIVPFARLRMEPKTVFIVDKSSVHDQQEMFTVADELLPDTIVKVWRLPTNSAKFLSPLDNGFHSELQCSFAELVQYTDRSESAVVDCVQEFFVHFDPFKLRSFYHHCGLFGPGFIVSRM
jgi:hypothetical protein